MKLDGQKLADALRYTVDTRRRAALTAFGSAAMFSLMVLLSFPAYSWQLLSANPLFIFEAVKELSWNLMASAGMLGLGLTAAYAVLGGSALTILVEGASGPGASTLTPGLLVSGCASCGTGLLGLLGLSGALAALPFSGNLVRLGGIGLILFFLARTGDPETCEI